jgi:hypothetical protein
LSTSVPRASAVWYANGFTGMVCKNGVAIHFYLRLLTEIYAGPGLPGARIRQQG